MPYPKILSLSVIALAMSAQTALAEGPQPSQGVKVLSDRTEAHLKPMFEAFQTKTGIKVEPVFMEQGLINRVEGNPTEADVVITKDAELMEIARDKHLIQPFASAAITDSIAKDFLAPDSSYLVDAYRARVIFYAKDRVKPGQLSTYKDLADPKWKDKICIRSGLHDYNVALFSQMETSYGPAETRQIIEGIHANLAREPKGNDREQAKGIFEGKCDIAMMNTYYHPIMADNPEQKPWADATGVFFPDQQGKGAFIMRSALALTTAKTNVAAATKLLEFFASEEGQTIITNATYQFPTNPKVPFNARLQTLGEGQPEVKNGAFKMNFVPLAQASREREAIVKVLNEVQFDKK